RAAVDVDGVHVGGAVLGELHGLEAGAAPDVQAAGAAGAALAEQVLPHQVAALGGDEHARLAQDVGEVERVERRSARVRPGARPRPGGAAPAVVAARDPARRGVARAGPGEGLARGGDVLGTDPAAAAD